MIKSDINFKKNLRKSSLKYKPSEQEILDSVLTGTTYGFVTVDLGVPSEWNYVVRGRPDFNERFCSVTPYEFFKEFPPLFMSIRLDYEDFSIQHDRAH